MYELLFVMCGAMRAVEVASTISAMLGYGARMFGTNRFGTLAQKWAISNLCHRGYQRRAESFAVIPVDNVVGGKMVEVI
ncbi:hypothetical protein ARMGADRAFT_1019512 [Armillaria gallica]|uniref:Uncharacterized protein n=1 Tax=Armillaria gallica TaxID=47427 RepID=A0A2H3CWA9_ARMGA|nr:hypothetical protein ARMGADRAFT_1019512 [Armillaria gallica]